MNHHTFLQQRRRWLRNVLFGSGYLGLRSMASGIPASVLADPKRFFASLSDKRARRMIKEAANAQYLVISVSDNGEPMNCNVPGMYDKSILNHPSADSMAPTQFDFAGQTVKAAKPWSTLTPTTLAKTCFFHYATRSFAHGGLTQLQTMLGAVSGGEMLISAYAKALQAPLGTIQAQPLNIMGGYGPMSITFSGTTQPSFTPTSVKGLLTSPDFLKPMQDTQALRDRDINALNALVKAKGTTPQSQLIDLWVSSQAQARALPQTILAQLAAISDDSITSQMKVAALFVAMKVTPVLLVSVGFGGDNHTDTDAHAGPGQLPYEAASHVTGVAAINSLISDLATAHVADQVTFTTLSTFGRSNTPSNISGRAHNGEHAVSVLIGANVKPGTVGGAQFPGSDPVAMAIDSQSGQGTTGGDIAFEKTLPSFGATLGKVLGLDDKTVAATVPTGTVVRSVV